MATDLDRYGRSLGKKFWPCAGLLGYEAAAAEQAMAIAKYVWRVFREDGKDIGDLVRIADRALRRPALFAEHDPSLKLIALASSNSLPAAQLHDVVDAIVHGRCPPERLIDELAAMAAGTVGERLRIERDYKHQNEMHARFEANAPQAIRIVAAWMRRNFLGESAVASARVSSGPVADVGTLLDTSVPLLSSPWGGSRVASGARSRRSRFQ